MRDSGLFDQRGKPLSIRPCSCSEAKSSTRIRGIVRKAEYREPIGTCERICSSVSLSTWQIDDGEPACLPPQVPVPAGAVTAGRDNGRVLCRSWPAQPTGNRSREDDDQHRDSGNVRRHACCACVAADADSIVASGSCRPHASAAGAATSGAQIDHLHTAIARLRRLRRRRHQQAFLAHADRLQPARDQPRISWRRSPPPPRRAARTGTGCSRASRPCRYGLRSGTGSRRGPCCSARWPSWSSVRIASGVRSAEPLAKFTVRLTAGPLAAGGAAAARRPPRAGCDTRRGCCTGDGAGAAASLAGAASLMPRVPPVHQVAARLQRVDDLVGRRAALSERPGWLPKTSGATTNGAISVRTGRSATHEIQLLPYTMEPQRGEHLCGSGTFRSCDRSTGRRWLLEHALGVHDGQSHVQAPFSTSAQLAASLVIQVGSRSARPSPRSSPRPVAVLQAASHIKIEQRAGCAGAERIARRADRPSEVLGAAQVLRRHAVETQRLRTLARHRSATRVPPMSRPTRMPISSAGLSRLPSSVGSASRSPTRRGPAASACGDRTVECAVQRGTARPACRPRTASRRRRCSAPARHPSAPRRASPDSSAARRARTHRAAASGPGTCPSPVRAAADRRTAAPWRAARRQGQVGEVLDQAGRRRPIPAWRPTNASATSAWKQGAQRRSCTHAPGTGSAWWPAARSEHAPRAIGRAAGIRGRTDPAPASSPSSACRSLRAARRRPQSRSTRCMPSAAPQAGSAL